MQHQIQAASATYTTAHGNAGSLTHRGKPGIEPASSWTLVRFCFHFPSVGTPFPFHEFIYGQVVGGCHVGQCRSKASSAPAIGGPARSSGLSSVLCAAGWHPSSDSLPEPALLTTVAGEKYLRVYAIPSSNLQPMAGRSRCIHTLAPSSWELGDSEVHALKHPPEVPSGTEPHLPTTVTQGCTQTGSFSSLPHSLTPWGLLVITSHMQFLHPKPCLRAPCGEPR